MWWSACTYGCEKPVPLHSEISVQLVPESVDLKIDSAPAAYIVFGSFGSMPNNPQ